MGTAMCPWSRPPAWQRDTLHIDLDPSVADEGMESGWMRFAVENEEGCKRQEDRANVLRGATALAAHIHLRPRWSYLKVRRLAPTPPCSSLTTAAPVNDPSFSRFNENMRISS
jgi:hypothetical protein